MREKDIISCVKNGFTEGSSFQSCGMELARRVWVAAVLGGSYSAGQLETIYGLVQCVLDGENCDIDGALYDLAIGLGMPAIPGSIDHPGMVRIMSIHHIVSTIQSTVMILADGSNMRLRCNREQMSPEMVERKKVSDMVRDLGRVLKANNSSSSSARSLHQGEHITAEEIMNDLYCQIEESKKDLPNGFFDLMIPSNDRGMWTKEQELTLSMISEQLAQETQLRRRMMVNRALATLKAFSSSQLIRKNPGLMRVLDSYTEEARETMEMICGGKIADVDDAFTMTKGEIVSLLMESTFDNDQIQKKTAKVKNIKIGSVPDRGGRPEGVSRAAALMPSWQKRKVPSQSSSHGKAQQKNSRKNINNNQGKKTKKNISDLPSF